MARLVVLPPQAESLPPKEFRLISEHERFDTPIDDRGLVDVSRLITEVKSTIDPEYHWRTDETSDHHFHWIKRDYLAAGHYAPDGSNIAKRFRELPISQGTLPVTFHNWLHQVTLPVPIPPVETMIYRIEAWDVVKNLYSSVYRSTHLQREAKRQRVLQAAGNLPAKRRQGAEIISQEILDEVLEQNFENFSQNLADMQKIPPEFWLIDPYKPHEVIAREVGKIVAPKALVLTRAATLPRAS